MMDPLGGRKSCVEQSRAGTLLPPQASHLRPVVDDDQLIDASLAGDSAAFGQLVRKYQDRLFNAIAHVAGSTEDARDVVQDALVQAFVKLETFQRCSAFYTWLFRIAYNTAVSHRRRRKPTQSVDEARDGRGEEPVDDGAPRSTSGAAGTSRGRAIGVGELK